VVSAGCALLIEPAYWTVVKPVPERTTSMSSSQQSYNRVFTKLQALHLTMHLKRLTVWVWVVGLTQGQSIQLSEIAKHIPGDTQAVSKIARVRCFLASQWIVSRALYPMAKRWGGAWRDVSSACTSSPKSFWMRRHQVSSSAPFSSIQASSVILARQAKKGAASGPTG
jgi:hypothetical protein